MVILRNKEDWRVYPEELARRSRDSVRVVRTCLEELERVGYVRTYRKSLGRGKGIQYYRFCSDKKISEAIKKKSIIIAALTVQSCILQSCILQSCKT
ncbi:phage replication protein [Streptococcus pyogenes]|nr:transcriptional regulator [Streptococcus pyogenes]BAQ53311.1 phage replication protein [Streptococcus pyogenes]